MLHSLTTALCLSGIFYLSTEVWSEVKDVDAGVKGGGGTVWATAEEEALDEVNDPLLFKAIVDSMRDWSNKHLNKTRRRRRAPSVCYDGVGCFDDTGYLDMAPSSPETVQTRFLLYSGRSPRSESPVMDLPFINISSIDSWNRVNVSLPTKVIVHGFGSSCANIWVYEMRSALMSVEECNVLCVDWENGATFPNYVRAAANTRLVGRQLSLLLEAMADRGLELSNVHLIGFSLGAHAAAFAGSRLSTVYRITGLDPAGPLFESQDPADRLDSTDAEFVDVIHSNGETLILGGLGSSQPMGHVDFYPNGGRMQKGCTNLFLGAFTDIIWSGASPEGRSLCNHRRAYKFFTDSVSPRCGFPALACHSYEAFLAGQCFPCPQGKTCPNMGYYADVTKARGTLYLVTREEEPFCAHQYLVRVESSPSSLPVASYGKIQITLISDSQINETFTLTTKDDEELVAGSALSKIIVPHPALERFSSLALLYTAYSGWISSGLAQWSVTTVFLMDSLSNKWTVCDSEIVLESGVEAVFQLVKGECNSTEAMSLLDSNWSNTTRTNSSYHPTEVVYIGDEILEGKGNATDSNATSTNVEEIVDLSPPKIGATQSWLYWGGTERSITVQLLPKRLARIVEGALSTDRVPRRLFSWFTAPHSAPTASHYIPTHKAAKPARREQKTRGE
ncbi:inactive pancreatic lipase-related protein 1-like [Cimex lectularius]|uniref:Lipase domain-containing protein n=1 Tax=Cimex lectularius TaxID=79782 RepID=A0A8I6RVJ6_CIMLE|nr:inactive pancreatic lipase-related protein 1-like [Cimex lectularius]XP_014250895.1 inactive pancreatic lipase-related protein 1-like [Cimex lectularius]XP_014250896.1 inactive pancreatic lipase-related protein 1-like [Cimex lectularius]